MRPFTFTSDRLRESRIWSIALVLPLLLVAPIMDAQSPPGSVESGELEPVGDEELEDFVIAFISVQELQNEMNEMTDERISESELDESRFFEINEIAQQSDSSDLSSIGDDELAEYREVLEDLIEIQNEQQAEMVDAVKAKDLTVDRFNRIMLALRDDSELAGRAEEVLEAAVDGTGSAE